MTSRILLLSLLGLSICRGLTPTGAFQDDEIDCHQVVGDEAYWTEERMRAAKPTPLSLGERGRLRIGGRPEGGGTAAPGLTLGQPVPADVAVWPYSAGGRLFYTKPQGDYWCSAELAGSNRALLTAAHCVRSSKTGDWYSRFLFVRAYEQAGDRYRGQPMRLKSVCTWNGFLGEWSPNLALDYSFFATQASSAGDWVPLATTVPFELWTAIGYPDNYGDGSVMYSVNGAKGAAQKGGVVEMLGNPMESGASGGAWIHLPQGPQGQAFVVGLNSAYGENETMFSPRFDAKTEYLLRHVDGCDVEAEGYDRPALETPSHDGETR